MILYVSIALFVVGVLIALGLAAKHFKAQPVAISSALWHGAFVASGLVLFIVASVQRGFGRVNSLSIGLFVTAALGGLVLFLLHLKGRALPKLLIFVHALVAVAGFSLLLLYVFKPTAG